MHQNLFESFEEKQIKFLFLWKQQLIDFVKFIFFLHFQILIFEKIIVVRKFFKSFSKFIHNSQSSREVSGVTLGVLSLAMKYTFAASTSSSDSLSEFQVAFKAFLQGFLEVVGLLYVSGQSVMMYPASYNCSKLSFFPSFLAIFYGCCTQPCCTFSLHSSRGETNLHHLLDHHFLHQRWWEQT